MPQQSKQYRLSFTMMNSEVLESELTIGPAEQETFDKLLAQIAANFENKSYMFSMELTRKPGEREKHTVTFSFKDVLYFKLTELLPEGEAI